MQEKNYYILVPNTELHERYLRMFSETLPNIGDNIQIELKESVYLERKAVFDKMNAIVTESDEAFLKKFPHPKIENEDGYI